MNRKLGREEEKAHKMMEEMELVTTTEENEQGSERLREMINQLPDKYRSVMELVSDGFTVKQIAGKLQIRPGTVKSRSSRAREMILRMNRSDENEQR
jgi:RNA polymerase sigma factor (sigma-70 family)